jgi:pyrroline-5-carboxylate reductase
MQASISVNWSSAAERGAVTELLIVGGGRMGSALLGGLLSGGVLEEHEVAVAEPSATARASITNAFPGVLVGEGGVSSRSAVLAVKPADVAAGCALVESTGATRVLSILAGVTIEKLESLLPVGTVVIRAMPNTPALLGAGATAIAAGSHADDADMDWAEALLGAVGLVVRQSEKSLDAVTGLSGSGPAYVFMVAEALIEAGVLAGLARETSSVLAIQTLLGASRMLAETGQPPEVLRAQVTSPGGTTAAGLHVLESAGVRAAFLDAVLAATARSKEIGQS